MWFLILFGLALLMLALAGARGILPPVVGLFSLGGFFFCLMGAILLGYQSRRAALAERSGYAATSMLVMMAGMLKDETDETLQRIADQGGPAGDAASMILQNRRETRPNG
jgi:hypothetical protein